MRKMIIFLPNFHPMYFGKATFLIPLYLSKITNMECVCYYGENISESEIPENYRGIRMVDLKVSHAKKLAMYWIILRKILLEAKAVDYLFMVHANRMTKITVILYKFLNPQGRIIVRGDMDEKCASNIIKEYCFSSDNLFACLKRKLVNCFFLSVNVFIAELPSVYDILYPIFSKNNWSCLALCPHGFDEELLSLYNLKIKSFEEKENIILTIGRIGSYQKNSEMLIEALEEIGDIKDWKIILVGPITDDFTSSSKKKSAFYKYIDSFYLRNPNFKDKVLLKGAVYDRKQLFEYYNRAKFFVMTSRYEGFANVMSEAAAFGCYIVSTDVGGASLVSNNWQFGMKVNQEDAHGLAKVLSSAISGTLHINPAKQKAFEDLLWSSLIKRNILPLLS